MDGQHSVLIVDRSQETREVLQTALERRGVRTLSAGRPEKGRELARLHQPDLIVLDLELDDSSAEQFSTSPCGPGVPPAIHLADQSPASQTQPYQPRMILLGNLRGWRDRLPEGEFVRKPYHYGPLIRKIEELLASGRNGVPFSPSDTRPGSFAPCQRCLSSAEPIKAPALN